MVLGPNKLRTAQDAANFSVSLLYIQVAILRDLSIFHSSGISYVVVLEYVTEWLGAKSTITVA